MAPIDLIIVRHGQSVGNVAAESAERAKLERIDVPVRDPDIELSELGHEQAAAVGAWLSRLDESERPDIAWTSPYRRARQTLQTALDGAGLEVDIRVDERLRDRDMGITDMLTAAGIREKYPEEVERRNWIGKFYYRPPGGESWADVTQRVRGVLTDIRHLVGEGTVLITAHDVVNLLFCYVAEGLDEESVLDRARTNPMGNAAICRLRSDEESPTGWTVVDYNLNEHLREENVKVTAQPGAADEVGAGNDQ